MKARSAAWRLPLMLAGAAILGMFAMSVVGAPLLAEPVIGIDTRELPAVSHHPIPRELHAVGTNGNWHKPTAVWLVWQEAGWLALSDASPHPFGCPVTWHPEQGKFMDPCLGQVFDVAGLNIAGPAPHGLDAYPVTAKSDTVIEVHLSRPQPVRSR